MVWKIAAILLVSLCSLAAQDSGDPLVERLANVKMFAFGGVGFASIATQGRERLRTSYVSPEPSRNSRTFIQDRYARSQELRAGRSLQPKSDSVQRTCRDAAFVESGSGDCSRLHHSQNHARRCHSKHRRWSIRAPPVETVNRRKNFRDGVGRLRGAGR